MAAGPGAGVGAGFAGGVAGRAALGVVAADLDTTGAPRPARAADVLRWTWRTEVEWRGAELPVVGPGWELGVDGVAPGSDDGTEGAGEATGPAGGRVVER
ncbi:hypothetical protein [Streptomyces sp. TLI_146]|uniref:hypothetical protein n=1 Tax=Streptomyces sp. TLI_146 TaxID=1938858 RepID=UPI000D1CF035|nr:hypothetical protein [Streptomyces sp. TLI_146]